MSENKKNRQSLKNIRRLHIGMVLGFVLIILIALSVVTKVAVDKTDKALKNQVIGLTSSLNLQMKINLDNYISRMENTATLAFGEKLSYTYDATDPDNDEYEALNNEKIISDRLFSLCIMENFVDYGIVYRNNRTVGKISNGTSSLFGENLYSELEKMIVRKRTEDGWQTGYNDDYRRIYYVKRVHDNAVLFISFYAMELAEVFDNPETLSEMDIRLVDQDYNIIYSKNSKEEGTKLSKDILDRMSGQSSVSFVDNEYLITVNRSSDWYVVCSIPSKIILKEKNKMTSYIYMTGLIACILAVLAGLYFSKLLLRSVNNIVYVLDDKARIDQLTGVFNKLTFEELSGSTLGNSLKNEHRALIILDIDDFKSVNDNYGHAAGDRLLENTGRILKEVFSDNDYVGRIGGDEFSILVNTNFDNSEKLKKLVEEKCKKLSEALFESKTAKSIGCRITTSIGAALYPNDGKTFNELYKAADTALYSSKSRGKNTLSFYKGNSETEQVNV